MQGKLPRKKFRRFYSEIMDNVKSAIYSNTLALIRENEMLSEEKFIRLSDADFSDAIKMLRDYGYGSSDNSDTGDFITSGINSLIAFVEEECHSLSLKKFILNQFIYGNAQLLYKSRFVEISDSSFYAISGLDKIKEANSKREYSALSEYMKDAFENLDIQSDKKTLTAKEIDIEFTRALNKDNLKCAEKCGRNIKKYYRNKIDLTNFLTTLRCRRLGVTSGDCKEMLLEGGYKNFDFFIDLLESSEELFSEKMSKTGFENIIAFEDVVDLTKAEERADDYLLGFTKSQIVNYTGKEPFLRYFLLKMREFGLIKYLLISLKSGNREKLKRRLRELYDSVG